MNGSVVSADDLPAELNGSAAAALPPNKAAWLLQKRSVLTVGAAPFPTPQEMEIVVRNRAVAINPIDWITQALGDVFFPWIAYPFILGSDTAGDVVAVGSGVTRFKVGDRVLGHAVGVDKAWNSAAAGTFQNYTILLENMASPIPDAMAYETATVLPLALSTAACGLFQSDQLALHPPSEPPIRRGQTVLIWGGSTSVGCNAIQLAVAAGYDVLTTASPRNFQYLAGLGAELVFDYKSKSVVQDIVRALKGRHLAGALSIGTGSGASCLDVVAACDGAKVVSMASTPVSFNTIPMGRGRLIKLSSALMRMVGAMAPMLVSARLRNIRTASIFSTSIAGNGVSKLIYADFLPNALQEGRYRAAPEAVVAGHGLESIQAAMDANKRGVSASKLVVRL